MWRIAGPTSPNASIIVSLIERAPASAPATSSTGPSAGSSKISRASSFGIGRARAGIGRPTTRKRGSCAALERVGEEDLLRERQRHPVREPEVGVGLRERGRDAHRRRREHHRPGDVAAGAEDDVAAAPAQDRAAGARRHPGAVERREERRRGLPREAADPEGVELVARVRDELRLDAIRRPGDRHEDAPLRQRVRHCERGQDVPGRPAGCDHAPKLSLRCHEPRC